MNKEKDKLIANDLKTIIKHFGVRNQLKKFNEETYELIEAINLYDEICFNSEGDFGDIIRLDEQEKHVTEEIADCMVLLNQFIIKYKIDISLIKKIFKEKIDRTIERIKEGYYDKDKGK